MAISNQQSAISNQQSAISNQQSAISNQQSAISNQQSAAIVDEKINSPNIPIYQKPKTSLFLEPRDIQGGSTDVPESNSGLLQS